MNVKGILRLATAGLLLVTIYKQHESIKKYKQDVNVQVADSLRTELFILQTELGKQELGLEHLKEIDSVEYEKVEEFINNETE